LPAWDEARIRAHSQRAAALDDVSAEPIRSSPVLPRFFGQSDRSRRYLLVGQDLGHQFASYVRSVFRFGLIEGFSSSGAFTGIIGGYDADVAGAAGAGIAFGAMGVVGIAGGTSGTAYRKYRLDIKIVRNVYDLQRSFPSESTGVTGLT